jgi:hypothetical protein
MKHTRALLIKFVMITVVLLVTLGFLYGVDFGDILTISLFLTIAAYLIGDMVILPQFGNTAATIADFGLAYLGTWLVGAMIIEQPIRLGVASFITALIIAIGEAFYHRYLTKTVIHDQNKKDDLDLLRPSYQTEFAEETNPKINTENNKNREENTRYTTEFAEETKPKLNEKSMSKSKENNDFSTEFGEEFSSNYNAQTSSRANIHWYQTEADTEFGEDNYISKKTKSNTKKKSQSQSKNDQYQTELGMEFSEPTNSKSVTNEKVGQSPNVTNDPSYYLRGHDFQSGYNYVSVEDNQTNMVGETNETGKNETNARLDKNNHPENGT